MAIIDSGSAGDPVARLARWRVPLGFVTAVAALVLARPTQTSWWVGLAVASVGAAIRVWAAGHIEKSREVTTSGPYRWTRHPLYAGSIVLALGIVLASRSAWLAVATCAYMSSTLWAAIRTEEAFLRRTFGHTYDSYSRAEIVPSPRRFSLERAWRNREYRAVVGLLIGFLLLAMRVRLPI